jgi:hypothetical protein
MALKEYLRRERHTPFTDEEYEARESQRERTFDAEFRAGRRLHPFTHGQIPEMVEILRIETGPFPDNAIVSAIPGRFAECVQRQAEIDTSGREITDEDQRCSYVSIPIDLAMQTTSAPAARGRAALPSSFRVFTARQRENEPGGDEENPLSPGTDLLADVDRYLGYLHDPARFGPG